MVNAHATKGKRRVSNARGTAIDVGRKLGSPNPDDELQVRDWLQSLSRPWAVDLYSGAGGLSLGLSQAGFSVVVAADRDVRSLETHSHNIGGLTWCGDLSDPSEFISQLRSWGINSIDLVAGGPPCQPFSHAGTPKIADLVKRGVRPAKDERAGLWKSFLTIIDELDAQAVLMENVPGFAAMQGGHSLITLLSQLENRGYKTFVKELKSWHYGVPQIRKRLFVTGLREPLRFQWPFPSTIKTTVQQAIGDLPIVGGGQRQEVLSYRQNGLSEFADRMRSSLDASEIGIIRDHVTRYVRDDDAKIFAGMKPGQTYKDVPEHLRRYRADTFADKYNRLTWDGLSRTITAHIAKDGYWYIHPEQDRSLSIREAARIQTFPDSFRFAGTPSNRYRQIGNAVPPLLAEKVGVSIRQALTSNGTRGSTSECYDQGVRKGLEEWHRKMRRPYAWRSERDPWYILLAEICLRRTNADQVHGMFQSLKELAATPGEMLDKKEEVREAMSHLGIVGRVDDLIKAAEKITETYGGIVPSTYDELIHLPGVGDYIASAVLCFAFDQPTTLLDTNTRRFARRFAAKAKMAPWEQRIMLHSLAKPGVADASWNYALLDLGALVCKASGPNCAECPLRTFCSTGKTRTQDGS